MTYDGRTFAEFIPERTSVYVEQEDKHMPELSVRETFNFAALCHGTGGKRGGRGLLQPCSRLHIHSVVVRPLICLAPPPAPPPKAGIRQHTP